MTRMGLHFARGWAKIGTSFLPFADAATEELPLPRLLRLSLFQVSVGIAVVLLIGTLNRVMIVELGVPAWLVAVMVSLPLVVAPFRALVGFKSDTHRSVLGWKRVPYIWIGTLLQFGGIAIMPFALLALSGDAHGPKIYGDIGGGLAFLLVGAGLHTTQTVGLALATDIAPARSLPKVVALLCVMMLVGVVASALFFGLCLRHFSEIRLIQVIQGAALATLLLNMLALWKQEPRDPSRTAKSLPQPAFRDSWRTLALGGRGTRRLVAVALGTIAFSMQDILLEPYGGQVLHLSVGATTTLTALLGAGGIAAFATGGWALARDTDPYRLAAGGVLVGLVAFAAVIFAAPFASQAMFAAGVALIGFGGGLFAVGTLTAFMAMAQGGQTGLALGTWGAVQASAAGGAVAAGGLIRDGVGSLATIGRLGPTLTGPATGYTAVYTIEIVMLFATLVAIGPLVRATRDNRGRPSQGLGLAGFPR